MPRPALALVLSCLILLPFGQLPTFSETEAERQIALAPADIVRDWTIHIVTVGYRHDLINWPTLLAGLPTQRDIPFGSQTIIYNIGYQLSFANDSYLEDVRGIVMSNSVNGSETGTGLDESNLLYQKENPDEPQCIFRPRAGRCIDAYIVEDWLIANPAVTPPALGYVLYMLNFSDLDTPGHGIEHWYDAHPVDTDSGQKQDWFRLEWDNAQNPNVTLEYAGFGGRGNIYVLDPSADQWYLRWARIWWSDPPYENEYEHCTMDLEDKVQSVDLSTSAGRASLNTYLGNYLYDPIAYLMMPGQHAPAAYVNSGLLRVLVFCMDVADGIPVESLTWITNDAVQRAHLKELLPFIPWQTEIDYLDINDFPVWKTLFSTYSQVIDGKVIADGGPMFDAIYEQMRWQYVDPSDPDVNVFGVVFVKKNMEMQVYGRTYTGLGGGGQTVVWKSWERYYRPDNVTPKSGVSSTQLHETMHAMGLGHTWDYYHYVADFSYSPLGYFGSHNGTSRFDQNWVQSTYLDQMELDLRNYFRYCLNQCASSTRPETALAETKTIVSLDEAVALYDRMDWQGCFRKLSAAHDWIRRMLYSSVDDEAPVVRHWGTVPEPLNFSAFLVWAQVDDDFAGVENVTVHALVNGISEHVFECAFDGGNWTATLLGFEDSVSLEVWVDAWDWGMNRAETPRVTYTRETMEDSLRGAILLG
ncbi:MAG: hypothetical protein C4K49_01920, partial [Candidatus Thorarchaeota archaeon]